MQTFKAKDNQLLSQWCLPVLPLPFRRGRIPDYQPCEETEYHEASKGASQASERRANRNPFQ
jgi:hypothetical protein